MSGQLVANGMVLRMIAQTITPRVQQWLRSTRSARVLHLFDEVCTLANERDEVVSLVSPAIGRGPFAAVLEGDFTSGLDIDQPISIHSSRQALRVGPLVVDTIGSAVWQPKPHWSRLRRADIARWPSAAGLPADIAASLELTIEGIVTDEPVTCAAGVARLVGRGGGLTPTGDDALVGILYGLWVWYPRKRRRRLEEWMAMIVEAAVPRTTILSANFLRAAADGEAVWQWHDLVNGSPDSVGRILSIGHTSGADVWAGFTYTGSVLSLVRPATAGPSSS